MTSEAKVISLEKRRLPKEIIFEIVQVGKVFHTESGFCNVLDGVNFRVTKGELICILGRSGCGKSTLLKILAGFMPPSSGTVLLNNKKVTRAGPDRCFVFQEDTLFPWLTVAENLAFGLKGKGLSRKDVIYEVEKFLSLVGLAQFRDYLPRDISGGMKQRVALAKVLLLRPQVLLMDEPFASLDAQTREEMQNLLLMLWEQLGHTILFVTHDVNEAVTLGDRVLLFSKSPGRIREEFLIDMSRPRSRDNEDFIFHSNKLYEALRD